ncbi:MAG: glycosyltransferase family 39 protein [Bacteroidales bacterium]|nr:glycosyltransferase family 39 protein [Bacteroidales bacterium]
MQNIKPFYINLLIILSASIMFIPFLGNVHLFDWDEINFAESAREMIVSGDYLNVQIDFKLFWEKPPLFIWMQVVSMKIFGINEFAARFPNAVAGILTLTILYNIGRKYFDNKLGLIWVIAYAGSVLPHLYFKSGIIDPWFNLFIFLGIYFFIEYLSDKEIKRKNIILSALFIGLGTLTKGPVALLLFLLTGFVFLLISKFKMRIRFSDILIYILTFTFVGGFWFILQLLNGNYSILYDFAVYQIELFQTDVAGHKGFFGYHFIILFFGVFPASIFALKTFGSAKSDNNTDKQQEFKRWMIILFWVVLILFSIVKTKIIHYSSMAYFPLTFLAAYAIYKTDIEKLKQSKPISGILIFLASFFAFVIFALQYTGQHNKEIIESGIVKDKFTAANLQAVTSWTGFEFLIGVFLILGVISAIIFFRKNYLRKVVTIFIISMLFTNLTLLIIVPKVEKISQNSAIEFYQSHEGEDAYFITYGMKSYAHHFYTKKKQPAETDILSSGQLLKGEINKPVYVTCRINKADEFAEKYPHFEKLYEKNGFVFWLRKD